MPTESNSTPLIERILAFSSLTIIAVALLSYFATLIVGLNNRMAMAEGLWPIVYGVSIIALPIGFVLLITLLILSQSRRRREFRKNAKKK